MIWLLAQDTLRVALINVRRAYRLLWMYQRRILDLVSEIAGKFDHNFYVWSPQEFDRPVRISTDPTSKWAWDLLPMYNTSFLYLPEGADRNRPRAGEWMLEISVQSDDGYDPKVLQHGEVDATRFRSEEQCRSLLGLYAWYSTKSLSAKLNWYSGIWCGWLGDGEVSEVRKSGIYESGTNKSGIKVVGMEFDLASLGDKTGIDNAVAAFKSLIGKKLGIKAR